MPGIRKLECTGDEVAAELLNHAAEFSYARNAELVTGSTVSRQTVRNRLLKAKILEKESRRSIGKVRNCIYMPMGIMFLCNDR